MSMKVDWEKVYEAEEEAGLNAIPDSVCPVCDGIELQPGANCPDCGYDRG